MSRRHKELVLLKLLSLSLSLTCGSCLSAVVINLVCVFASFFDQMVRSAARDGVWVQQRDGTMFTISEESITSLLELCQR